MKTKRKNKLTVKIMNRVVDMEKNNIGSWIRRSAFVLLLLIGGLIASLVILVDEFSKHQSFALLNLFYEDIEIISDYWRDTLLIFWEEAPQMMIVIFLVFSILFILILLLIKKGIVIIKRKLKSIDKYF